MYNWSPCTTMHTIRLDKHGRVVMVQSNQLTRPCLTGHPVYIVKSDDSVVAYTGEAPFSNVPETHGHV